jgi:hypothetical protein
MNNFYITLGTAIAGFVGGVLLSFILREGNLTFTLIEDGAVCALLLAVWMIIKIYHGFFDEVAP